MKKTKILICISIIILIFFILFIFVYWAPLDYIKIFKANMEYSIGWKSETVETIKKINNINSNNKINELIINLIKDNDISENECDELFNVCKDIDDNDQIIYEYISRMLNNFNNNDDENDKIIELTTTLIEKSTISEEECDRIFNLTKNLNNNDKIIFEYASRKIKLLENSNDYTKNIEQYLSILNDYLFKISDYDGTTSLIDLCKNKISENIIKQTNNYINYGISAKKNYRNDLEVDYFKKAISLMENYKEYTDLKDLSSCYYELAKEYANTTMYANSIESFERAINYLEETKNEELINSLLEQYQREIETAKEESAKNKYCEAYGCARTKSTNNSHYCSIHSEDPDYIFPVATVQKDNTSGYSYYHKCEFEGCTNYASCTQYCSKHTTYEKCAESGCSNNVSYSGAKYCMQHEIEKYNKNN